MNRSIIVVTVALLWISWQVKAEEVCGETIHTNWAYDPKEIKLESVKRFPEKFCDPGLPLPGANYELVLLDDNHRPVFKKQLHFSMIRISHGESGKAKDDKLVEKWRDFQAIKLPYHKGMEKVKSFNIVQLEDKKILAKGAIQF